MWVNAFAPHVDFAPTEGRTVVLPGSAEGLIVVGRSNIGRST